MQTTPVLINGFFGSMVEVEMPTDGRIDDVVVEVFTAGHCHSFALALSERLPGSEIVGLYWEAVYDDDGDSELYVPNHVAVRDNSGKCWDVSGRVRRAWDAEPVDRELVLAAFDGEYHEPRPELAEFVLDLWFELHGEEVAA